MHPRKNVFKKTLIDLIDKTIGSSLLSNSDLCLALTRIEKNWLESLGANNISVLPNCIPEDYLKKRDPIVFKKKHRINGNMIFWLGAHIPIKNLEEIIATAAFVKDATFVLGGKPTEYTKKIIELAKKLQVDKRIRLVGEMNEKEKMEAYSAADAFILTSKFESFSYALIEAMSQECPVIAPNVGGIPEVVPDNFCLYPLGNFKELARKINLILENKKLSKKIGKKGKEKVKKLFTFKTFSKKYVDLLKNI